MQSHCEDVDLKKGPHVDIEVQRFNVENTLLHKPQGKNDSLEQKYLFFLLSCFFMICVPLVHLFGVCCWCIALPFTCSCVL